ncbi:MAG: molybdenum cofactor guanylyltransferase [Deltaproteobacteria bacterium]|nr:molybdenum cofactor guanylyltransferase [Candidatus Tharpella sp.]
MTPTLINNFPLSGAVLAGGRARRLDGLDKTLLHLGRESLLSRTLGILNSFCRETLISSNTLQQHPQGRIVPDLKLGQGPLGAIYSCLQASNNPYLQIVAGDMPFISAPGLIKLWREREGFDVIIPQTPDGLQPLAALYKQSCIPHIAAQLEENNFKIRRFFSDVKVKIIICSDFPDIYPDHTFLNINSPKDLQKAREIYHKTN